MTKSLRQFKSRDTLPSIVREDEIKDRAEEWLRGWRFQLGLLLEFETRGLVNHWTPEESHGSVKFSVPCELVNNEFHALLSFSSHDGVCLRAIDRKRGKYIAKSWNERISMDGNLNELLSTDSNFEGILIYDWGWARVRKEMEKSDLLCVIKYKNKNIRRYRGRSKIIKK